MPDGEDIAKGLGGEKPADKPDRTPDPGAAARRKPGRPTDIEREAEAAEAARIKAPRDLITFWPMLIQRAREERNVGPDWIVIGAQRIPIATAVRQEATSMTPVDGSSVCGSGPPDYVGAGEDLVEYATQVWHVAARIESLCRYRVHFNYKDAKKDDAHLGTCDLILGPTSEIKAQRAAAENMRSRRVVEGSDAGAPLYDPAMPQRPRVRPATMPGYTTAPDPQAPQGASYSERALYEQNQELLARERRLLDELQAARTEGRPPNIPVAPPPTSQEEEDARIARIVASTLKGMGITAPVAGVGAVPSPAVAPAQPPIPAAPTAAQVDSAVREPIDAMEQFFNQMDRFDAMRDRIAKRFTPVQIEEPDIPEVKAEPISAAEDPFKMRPVPVVKYRGLEPIMFRTKKEEEGWAEYAFEHAMSNPTIARDLLRGVVSEGEIGALIRKFAGLGPKAIETTGEAVSGAAATVAPNGGTWVPKA